MTLSEATVEFEKLFAVVIYEISFPRSDSTLDWSRAPNGEKYITLTENGPKPEGLSSGPGAASEPEAVEKWLRLSEYWWASRGNILYWRTRPEIVRHNGHWGVYSRMAFGSSENV